jgi:hypothetical protein
MVDWWQHICVWYKFSKSGWLPDICRDLWSSIRTYTQTHASFQKNTSECTDVQCIIDPVKIAIECKCSCATFWLMAKSMAQTNMTPIFAIGTLHPKMVQFHFVLDPSPAYQHLIHPHPLTSLARPGLNNSSIEGNVAERADLHVESHQWHASIADAYSIIQCHTAHVTYQ